MFLNTPPTSFAILGLDREEIHPDCVRDRSTFLPLTGSHVESPHGTGPVEEEGSGDLELDS